MATLLLDPSIVLDAELGRRIDNGPGRPAFIQYFIANKPDFDDSNPFRPWEAFIQQLVDPAMHDGELTSFVDRLRRESWLRSDVYVKFQVRLFENTAAARNDGADFLKALLDFGITYDGTCRAFLQAFTYAQTHLLPMLSRIWLMPDDLPHAASHLKPSR